MKNKQLLVVDPTAFLGGSKIATENILSLLDKQKYQITVLSADKKSWQDKRFNFVYLFESKWLAQQEQGIAYFIRHLFIALQLLLIRLRIGQIDLAIGASGPGVDLSLYLLQYLLKYPIIQLVHGPVATSRTIQRCLQKATQVHYLQSCEDSLRNVLGIKQAVAPLPQHFQLLSNGLSKKQWPSRCQMHYPSLFWAASLLKWKGLDTLLSAVQKIPESIRPQTQICYIRPRDVQLPVTEAPQIIEHVHWHETPDNLDEIRASANIFVSTSNQEPFGLSILEALAAGQCVLIPNDGAYWDEVLTDRVNCIKYQANNPADLHNKLLMLLQYMPLVREIGKQAVQVAQHYQAEKQYQNTLLSIHSINQNGLPKSAILRAHYDKN